MTKTLRQAIRQAWRTYRGRRLYNDGWSIAVYYDPASDTAIVEEFIGDGWLQDAGIEILRLCSERWYAGEPRPEPMLLREAMQAAEHSLEDASYAECAEEAS